MALSGRVCVVTGATKGIGKGIALQLGEAGAKVYITGRSVDKLQECSEEVKARGGLPVPVRVDHSNDEEVFQLFEKIKKDNEGRLDVVVNNAYAGVDMIAKNSGKKFFESDPAEQWDCINGVGLRNHFLCAVYASRIMAERRDGLIVNVSSPGGLRYLFNVCYGTGKAAVDRMSVDCAIELKKLNITSVSLWPGPVKTEYVQENILTKKATLGSEKGFDAFSNAESMEFAGKAVAKLAADPGKFSKTGKILLVCDLAREYGFVDDDGDIHDMRSLSNILKSMGHTWIASVIPAFVRVPSTLVHLAGSKF